MHAPLVAIQKFACHPYTTSQNFILKGPNKPKLFVPTKSTISSNRFVLNDRYQWRYGHIPHFCRINGMISSFKFLNNNFPLSRGIAPIRGHALGFYLGKILFVVPFLNSTVSCSCYPDDVERVRSYMYDII